MKRPRDLADELLADTRLSSAERTRVRDELRAHIDDALAAGKSLDDVRSSLGDSRVLASALAQSPPPMRRSRMLRLASVATVATLAWYCTTAVRLGTYAMTPIASPALDSIAALARLSVAADAALNRSSVAEATEIASRAAASGSAFGEYVARGIARRALPRVSSCSEIRAQLLTIATMPAPDVRAWYDVALSHADGRSTANALRLIQAMKGIRTPTWSARVLEPFYFATATSPADVWFATRSAPKAERHTELSRCAVPSTRDPQGL